MQAVRTFIRSHRNAVALVCGFLLAFLAWWWVSSRKSAEPQGFSPASQLDRIEYAVGNARSWRATITGTMHGRPFQTDQDVVCPFESHTVTHVADASGTSTVVEESVETEDTVYAHEGTDAWHSEPRTGPAKCSMGPMAGPVPLIAVLTGLKGSARLNKGQQLQSDKGGCRVWSFIGAAGPVASLCVDEDTQLPYELRMGTVYVQYSNWNMPLAIGVPAVR